MIRALAAIILLNATAHAQQVRIVALPGEGALTNHQRAEVIERARLKYAGAGLRVTATKILFLASDPCESQRERDRFPSQFTCYERLGLSLKRFRYGPTLILSAPMRGGGERWLGGVARRDCTRHISRRVSWAAATGNKVTGEDRKEMSAVLVAHELGHNIGAGHADSRPNVMHSTALIFTAENFLGFLQQSVAEIRSCNG